VGSREGSAAFHGALVRARFASEHVVGAGVVAFGFGRGAERGMEDPLGEAEGVLDVGRERACRAFAASSCSCIRPRAELATIPAGAMSGGSMWRWMCTDERAKGKDVSGRA
jgi:hypothetical protein